MMDVRESIQNWCNEVNQEAMVNINYTKKVITICTTHPGYFIGVKGILYDKYAAIIKPRGFTINFLEAHEHFKPGDDWGEICDRRAQAFFELEG